MNAETPTVRRKKIEDLSSWGQRRWKVFTLAVFGLG
jgi:hypothetical protein